MVTHVHPGGKVPPLPMNFEGYSYILFAYLSIYLCIDEGMHPFRSRLPPMHVGVDGQHYNFSVKASIYLGGHAPT